LKTRLSKPWLWITLLPLVVVIATSCNSGKDAPTGPGGGGGGTLNSDVLQPGATFQHQFAAAGTFPYHCIFHSPMRGAVQVASTAADSIAHVSITSSTMAFPPASVRPGGIVIWTNNTDTNHTVTSD
jgi:plastocyanin